MTPGECEFVLAATPAANDPAERLAERLALEPGASATEERMLLDTFDARLRAAGLQAYWAGGRLVVREPAEPVRSAEVAAAGRYLAGDLPAGPLRDRIAGVLAERALLPVARVRVKERRLAALNADRKTVARLTIEESVVLVRGRGAIPLAPRIRLSAVRGYDRAFARTEAAIRGALDVEPATEPFTDLAVRAAGGEPEGVSSKPKVDLSKGAPAAAQAGLVLARLADIAEANVPGTLDDLDTEFLHDLRVSVRRARSVLRELRLEFPQAPLAHLRRELRWVQQLTGPVRDLDVELLEWDALVAVVPDDRAADLEPVRRLLEQRRARALGALRRGLRGRRFAAALDAWRAFAVAVQAQPGDGRAPVEAIGGQRIRHVYGRMVRDGRAIGAGSPPEALHDLRKRGKELRYLLEFFGGLYPAAVVKPMVAALKDLQDVLGRFQDRAIQVDQLRDMRDELAAATDGPAALIAIGSLIDAQEADQRAARDAFADRFAAFASKEERSQVKRTFPKAARS